MSVPQVKKGKWSKERERTKSGRWRKKRSDAGHPRVREHNRLKYALALIAAIVILAIVVYRFFPGLFTSLNPFKTGLWLNIFSSFLN